MTDELAEARQKRDRKKLADAVMEDMGVSADKLAAISEVAPDEVREAILDGLQRQEMYRELGRRHAVEDEAEGVPGDRCCNGVCPRHKQTEHESVDPVTSLVSYSGRRNYCTDGVNGAQGCIYRMSHHPPSDPFRRLPSHQEAVNMLARAGLLKGDDFGQWNGTDFAFHQNTEKLWFAYLQALKDLGKIPEGTPDNWSDIGEYARKELVK